MCILLTPVLYFITTVIIEAYYLCLIESVSLRDIGKSALHAEISSSSSLFFKVLKRAQLGSLELINEIHCWFSSTFSILTLSKACCGSKVSLRRFL